jgi:hypothetical protein
METARARVFLMEKGYSAPLDLSVPRVNLCRQVAVSIVYNFCR